MRLYTCHVCNANYDNTQELVECERSHRKEKELPVKVSPKLNVQINYNRKGRK